MPGHASATTTKPRTLACIGDANDASVWSGIPYHFLCAGKRLGFLDWGWAVHPEKLRRRRLYWNLLELSRTGRRGGYQYSRDFLTKLVEQVPPGEREGEIISHFPLLPPMDTVSGSVSFYIDLTLSQLFSDYGVERIVSPRVMNDALARERDAYQRAERIVCMSRQTAAAVIEKYGLASDKVHVVPGGSNLDESRLPDLSEGDIEPVLQPLRLGFMGKDIRRKNLSFVLDVADELHARGYEVEVIAAGFDPKSGPHHPLLRAIGFLDKRLGLEPFFRFIRSCHFGCLFSSVEAFGMSNREFIRLGVPVLTWNVGGLPDTVPEGLGHVFSAKSEPGDIADWLEDYLLAPHRYATLRSKVAARANEVSWDRTVESFQAIWQGSEQYSYARSEPR